MLDGGWMTHLHFLEYLRHNLGLARILMQNTHSRGGEIGRHRRLKISRPKGVTVRVRPAAPNSSLCCYYTKGMGAKLIVV